MFLRVRFYKLNNGNLLWGDCCSRLVCDEVGFEDPSSDLLFLTSISESDSLFFWREVWWFCKRVEWVNSDVELWASDYFPLSGVVLGVVYGGV